MRAPPPLPSWKQPLPPPQPMDQRLDSGMMSLATIAGHYRIAVDPFQLAHDLGLGTRPSTGQDIVRAAQRIGLKARYLHGQRMARLSSVPLPAIIRRKDGSFCIVAARGPDGQFRVADPVRRIVTQETAEALSAAFGEEVILVTRRFGGVGIDPQTFGFRWFLPSLWRYRKPLGHVLLVVSSCPQSRSSPW